VTKRPAPGSIRPTWTEVRELSYAAAMPGRSQVVALADAVGRALVSDLVAEYDLPHYASSAMDGWAVNGPPPWKVVEAQALRAGECRPIVTGGLIPEGAVGVLRSERAEVRREGSVDLVAPNADARVDEPRDGEHIRPIGTEAHKGDVLIQRGTRLNPAHVALAASVGLDELTVITRPRVRIVVTGDEVVPAGVPRSGRVRDSFGPTLPWLVASLGGQVVGSLRARDSDGALRDALSSTPTDHDLVITTGGTGTSSADHLHPVAQELGVTLLADGVRMRPGGPSILGRFPDGRFLVGLPGNPLAAMLALITIGQPLIAAMTGAPAPQLQRVTIGEDISGKPGVSALVPYSLVDGRAMPSAWMGSGMMRGLAASTGVLVCPPEGIAFGEDGEAFSLPWGSPRG
jgi:molybdopterin molybdotransferase